MLQDADVLKIKCKFVEEVIKFLNKSTYSISTCYKQTLPYFSDILLLATIECLDSDIICDLQNKADKYTIIPGDNVDSNLCEDQATITVQVKTVPCNLSLNVANTGNGSSYPYISSLINNSISQEASINVTASDCENTSTQKIGCWCNGTPEVCSGGGIKVYTGFTVANVYSATPSACINTLKLSYVNNNTVTNEFLYIHPTNVSAYTGCGACEAITEADLYFPTSAAGNLTFKTA